VIAVEFDGAASHRYREEVHESVCAEIGADEG
jgi:hypothetical protein